MAGLFLLVFLWLCMCLSPLLWVIYSKLLKRDSKSIKAILAEF